MQTFNSIEYLKISIANSMGLDKLTWNERLDWFDKNQNNLHSLVQTADEQAKFYGGLLAWEAVQKGEPIGFPISLDATASGMQWLAILSGCKKTARLTNVIDAGKRMDAYTELHGLMNVRDVSRADAKQAIMTSFYNSKATPKRIFPNEAELVEFYRVLSSECPGAFNLNSIIQMLQDPTAIEYKWTLPDGFEVVSPVMGLVEEEIKFLDDYYTVTYKKEMATDYDNSLSPNYIHSVDSFAVREITRRCSYEPHVVQRVTKLLFTPDVEIEEYEDTLNLEMTAKLWNLYVDTGILSARILDYLDEETITLIDPVPVLRLLETFPTKPFELLFVHDCALVHPNYGNDIRKMYNQIMWEVADSNLLNFNMSQIASRDITINPIEKFTKNEILNANYALS